MDEKLVIYRIMEQNVKGMMRKRKDEMNNCCDMFNFVYFLLAMRFFFIRS